jgi:hypothetical protein
MTEFTPEAEARLAEYLRQVRAALAGSPDVNPDEIEADIREHVGNEFRLATRPVPRAELEAVLARLGPPGQWLPSGRAEPPPRGPSLGEYLGNRWRAARDAIWRGPEDWRLAYLTLATFAIGLVTFVIPVFLLVSYILGRAGIALAREKGIELGAARKWLLYPPVVLVSLKLLLAVVIWPVALGVAAGAEVEGAYHRVQTFDRPDRDPISPREVRELRDSRDRQVWKERMARQVEEDRQLLAMMPVAPVWGAPVAALFVGAGALSLWWAVLGFVGASFPRAVRAVFVPLCDHFESRHGWRLGVVSLLAFAIWAGFAHRFATEAGLI